MSDVRWRTRRAPADRSGEPHLVQDPLALVFLLRRRAQARVGEMVPPVVGAEQAAAVQLKPQKQQQQVREAVSTSPAALTQNKSLSSLMLLL